MGLKVKAGLALGGLVVSWMCGLNFLTGIASHLDSTGNILVDIADGIGIVSKGIEALENYLDPSSAKKTEETEENTASEDKPPDGAEGGQPVSPELVYKHHPVICKRGKCERYDPTKDRVLQQQLIKAERERILQQVRNGEIASDTVLPRVIFTEDNDDEDEEEDESKTRERLKKIRNKGSQKDSNTIAIAATTSKTPTATAATTTTTRNSAPEQNSKNSSHDEVKNNNGGWRFGVKRVLNRSSGLLQRLNSLILRLVNTVFPWNKRARRRLAGDNDDGGAD